MLISLLCSAIVSTSVMAGTGDAKTVFDYVKPRVRYTNLAVSQQALSRSDVARWGGLLGASDAQLQLMLVQYASFVEQQNVLLDHEAPRLLERSAGIHLAQVEEGGYTDAHSRRMRDLLQHCARLRRQLEQLEQSYIDSIEPFFTKEQVERLPLLRNEAVRRQCRTRPTTLPWAHLDVRSLWEQVDDSWLSPEEREWVMTILWEHDQAVTPLLRGMTDSFWSTNASMSRTVVQWQSGAILTDEYNRIIERSLTPYLRSLLRLAAVNENAAAQIVETIPDDVGREFLLLAKTAAYPQLYPDRTALHDGFRAMLNDDELDDDLLRNIQQLFVTYDMEYEQAAHQAERFYLEWSKLNVLSRQGYFTQHLPEALEPKLLQRLELAQRWLEQLAEAVGEDILHKHGVYIAAEDDDEDQDEDRIESAAMP
jgi:hypothetical protein